MVHDTSQPTRHHRPGWDAHTVGTIQAWLSEAALAAQERDLPDIRDGLRHVPCWVRVTSTGIEMRVWHPGTEEGVGGLRYFGWVEAAAPP
jgi:hypothetical protein